MELVYGFFAASAELVDPGHFSVLGGGIEGIRVNAIPYKHPLLAVILKFRFSAREAKKNCKLNLKWLKPKEKKSTGPGWDTIIPATAEQKDGGIGTALIRLAGTEFDVEGIWKLQLTVEGKKIGELDLRIFTG